ncbi:molybdate ABC transporter substrate-binding protein [Halobacillus sp. K22]|uniref:molybdate ABC transporter substrate-binding protein n=1 Tax=Halobacillus sp. K22 TaxID=3457431 RepID=UPI003FCDE2CC
MKLIRLLACIVIIVSLASCSASSEENKSLTISAAASLTDAIKELIDTYESSHNTSIQLNLASSGKLARQIEQGAPVDLYLSANQKWMDQLEAEEQIESDSRRNFTSNHLVIIGPKNKDELNSLEALATLPPESQIAVGEPESVPAGSYTKQALKKIQIWEALKEQLVFASDVRQVLTYVESGNVSYGIVYGSDAKISDQVHVLTEIDPALHKPIVYPGAVLSDSEHKQEATDFLRFLETKEAKDIMKKYGFQS